MAFEQIALQAFIVPEEHRAARTRVRTGSVFRNVVTSVAHRAERRRSGCRETACTLICKSLRYEIHRRSRCIAERWSRSRGYNRLRHKVRMNPRPPPAPNGSRQLKQAQVGDRER